ncbi:hypothetical protein MUN89_00715 [Halobacillus salinarum]|uniref:DUF4870 domain-containing protein n=1 Tax=Halobacillus salinarum TaxID=2932257 RepID=A0ABY4EKC9_9BACI|nr:DUF4870 domain-containing protein [Halobacillus salinarum]UOQ44551.1 hypothetical protein MUN89_00715 [Halobacillus salinarum]
MDQKPNNQGSSNPSSTGLEENIGGLLAYLLGFVTGIVFLIIEKKNETIRFHAWQSTIVFGGLALVTIVLNFIPVIGFLWNLIIGPLNLILWIVLMVMAYQGKRYHLPVCGDLADQQLRKMG